MKYYLLVCERSTGIVLMQDCATRFYNHDGTTELPYMEIEIVTDEPLRHRVLAILLMHPEVEVVIFDEQKSYIGILPADH